jgi:hypothetical protein
MQLKPKDIERFWAKVERRGPDDCWLWLGGKSTCNTQYTPMTYGAFRQMRAHRVAWQIANGREPLPFHVICHRCDVPLCCNPAHLFEGTRADNQRDMQLKQRSGILGEKNPKAKVTVEQVLEIRAMDATVSNVELAARYGVDDSTIYSARVGRKWKNLPGAKPLGFRKKLTRLQVIELRRRHRAGEMTTDLAKAFGISQGYVSQVAYRYVYKNVSE